MNDELLQQVVLALGHVLEKQVKAIRREEWDRILRAGGEATQLNKPLGPYLGVQGAPGFEVAVASGAPAAEVPGFHHVLRDEDDAPEGLFNIYSHDAIVDLPSDPHWPDTLRVAGLEPTDELLALVRAHVFGYPQRRDPDDHWSPSIPKDIADALPKDAE